MDEMLPMFSITVFSQIEMHELHSKKLQQQRQLGPMHVGRIRPCVSKVNCVEMRLGPCSWLEIVERGAGALPISAKSMHNTGGVGGAGRAVDNAGVHANRDDSAHVPDRMIGSRTKFGNYVDSFVSRSATIPSKPIWQV